MASIKNIRERAMEMVKSTPLNTIKSYSSEKIHEILNELHVHQIELEIQNDELRHTKEELEMQRDKYSNLYDFAPIGYLSLNTLGTVLDANLKCTDMLKIKRNRLHEIKCNRLHELSITHFIKTEDLEFFYLHICKIVKSKKTESCEIELIRKDKTSFHARLVSEPLIDKRGVITEIRVAIVDISELKHAHEELQKKQKIEALGLLAGGIAHDFNNLLCSLFGYLEMAREYTKESVTEDYLNTAIMCFERMKDLTQQLTTFAKGGVPAKKTVSIKNILSEASKIALSGSNCSCKITIADGLSYCDVDPGQINQVFTNIFLNAQHAMPEGGVIVVKAKNVELSEAQVESLPQGKYILITITDGGMGIPPHLLNKVLDPYFTTKKTGSGLGLATSYSIISQHKGSISIKSQVETGTTVAIFLPASGEHAIAEENDSSLNIVGSEKILVMDDELAICEVAKQLLSILGYEVDIAENGEIALEKYQAAINNNERFDVVILDLTIIGGMGGETTMQKLLEIDPNVKGIVSSGYSNNSILVNPKKYGFTSSIKKPFLKNELGRIIRDVLEKPVL